MIIGLAGHVDHGKSALTTALTGAATDRNPEERERGITIDLQAVALRHADGSVAAALMDVPGHEDFLRTMVAGASGIAAALLVIAADEGVMPQTREHLLVLERLGVTRGIPVLTKIDLVDRDLAELAAEEVAALLSSSPIAFDAPALVSARRGDGIGELRDRILALAADYRPAREADFFRMSIDKVFSRAGVGTIVTGTTWSGQVHVGDTVQLLPLGEAVRVRSLESHASAIESAGPGLRLAVGLAGLDRSDVGRGDVLVLASDAWPMSSAFDAWVTLAPTAARALQGRPPIRVHLGTAELPGKILPRRAIEPGASGPARIVLDRPMVLRGGDRVVLRSWSPATTVGGGIILDPSPPARAPWPEELASDAAGLRLAALARRRRHGVFLREVPFLVGVPPSEVASVVSESGLVQVGDRLLSREALAAAERAVLEGLARYHCDAPMSKGQSVETLRRLINGPEDLSDHLVARLVESGKIVLTGELAALKGFKPQIDLVERAYPVVLAALGRAGLEAPTTEGLIAELGAPEVPAALRLAEQRGAAVQVERGRWVDREAADGFLALLRELGAVGPIGLAAVRDRTGLSRKFLIPLLDWADRTGTTRREGEGRVLVRPR